MTEERLQELETTWAQSWPQLAELTAEVRRCWAEIAAPCRLERFLAERGCICLHPDRERCEALRKQPCVCSCHGRLEYAAQEESNEGA